MTIDSDFRKVNQAILRQRMTVPVLRAMGVPRLKKLLVLSRRHEFVGGELIPAAGS